MDYRINLDAGKLFGAKGLSFNLHARTRYGRDINADAGALVSAMPWIGAVQGFSLYGGMAITIRPKYKVAESGFLFTGAKNESTSWNSVSDAFDDGV
jgi:hypothetical protein